MAQALSLFWHFLLFGSIAVGGVSTVMPGMYHYMVEDQGLLSGREFAELYTIGQAAPGPNALWVTLVGLHTAGWMGAIATTLGVLTPATAFSFTAAALHARHADSPIVLAIRRGLAPVALGFMLSSGWILLTSVGHDWRGYGLAAATMAVALRTNISPLWLIAAGGAAGVAGLI